MELPHQNRLGEGHLQFDVRHGLRPSRVIKVLSQKVTSKAEVCHRGPVYRCGESGAHLLQGEEERGAADLGGGVLALRHHVIVHDLFLE